MSSSSDDQATFIITGGTEEPDGTKGWASSTGIGIDPDAPEQGVCSITTTSGAANSLLTGGIWQNSDAGSLLSAGIINTSQFVQADPNCFLGVIHTKHGPLTKGWGDARLAEPDDVEIIINGAFREVFHIEPTQGIIVLVNPIAVGASVQVSYFYTPNPTVNIASFNNEGYLFNQAGVASYYQKFPFTSVFGPDYQNPQPQEIGHIHTAFQRGYTAVFNDPTVLRFNEPPHTPGHPHLGRNLESFSVSFEGDHFPKEPWEVVGTQPVIPEFEEGLFIIDDISSSQNVIDSDPLFYQQETDISFDHIATINFRLQVFDYQKAEDFTGIAAGYASDQNLYLLGFLEVGGFQFAGFLENENEEDRWESYQGLTTEVVPVDDNGNLINTRLRYASEPPFEEGSQVFVEGSIYEVDSVSESTSNPGFYDVILTTIMPSSVTGTIETFPEIEFNSLNSYRIFKNEEGNIQAFVGGSPFPFAEAEETDLALGTETFEILDFNQVFFGSVSRQGESRSGWDFIRYSINPNSPTESAKKITVRSDFEELPEKHPDTPWSLLDDQGYSEILSGDKLLLEQAGRVAEGSFSYARIEPLLTSQFSSDFQTSLRVDSFSVGSAASVTMADERKEVTISLFAEDLTNDPADFASYLVSGGQSQLIDPVTILSGGAIPPSAAFSQDTPIPRFRAAYSGTASFEDEGWTSSFDDVESTFIDRWHRIQKEEGLLGSANIRIPFPDPNEPFEKHLFSTRLRMRDGTLTPENIRSLRIGIDDDLSYVSLAFWDDGNTKKVVFTDDNGIVEEDNFGDPVGVSFDWGDQEFHTYRVLRTQAGYLLFIDGIHAGTFTNLPSSVGNNDDDHYVLFIDLLEPEIELDLNYFFAHSTDYGPEKVGLYMGGDIKDPSSYEFVPTNWIGEDLDIRIHRDPAGKTQIFLNDETDPSFVKQYSELPDRNKPPILNTDLGYIRFGHLDPRSFSHSEWEYIRYRVNNVRHDLKTLQHSVFNAAHKVSSPEGLFDDEPDLIKIFSDTEDQIFLSSKMIGAVRVLDVLSEDESQSYDFDFNKKTQEVTILDGPLPEHRTPLKLRYLTDKPHGHKYLKEQDPVTKLNEETPPFPLSLQKILTVSETPVDPDSDIFNGASSFSVSNDGKTKYTFTVNDDALYESLDLRSSVIRGETGNISPACDDLGWTEIILEEWDETYETYQIPDQGQAECIYSPLILDDPDSTLDDATCVRGSLPFLNIDLKWTQEEEYPGPIGDELEEGKFNEVAGLLLDVADSTLDNEEDLLDTYDVGADVPITFEIS